MAMGPVTKKFTLTGRLLFFVLICSLCMRCKGQDRPAEKKVLPAYAVKDSLKSSVMKKFNIDEYEEKLKKDPGYEGYTAPDGTEVTEYYRLPPEAPDLESFDRRKVLAYTRIEEHPDGYRTAYQFNKEGNLTAVSYYYSTSLETGKWQQFDDAGKLTGETDKDKGYAFTLSQVIGFGKRNGVDFAKTGRVQREYDRTYNANVWILRWVVDEAVKEPYQQIFILDGETGRVLKDYKEGPPQRL